MEVRGKNAAYVAGLLKFIQVLVANRLEAAAPRLEAIANRLEAIAISTISNSKEYCNIGNWAGGTWDPRGTCAGLEKTRSTVACPPQTCRMCSS